MRPMSRIGLFSLFIAGLNSPGFAQSGIITTYAGPTMPVDGGLATSQAFDRPASVVSDGAGGFYFASQRQSRVYRVSMDGKLIIVAGDGTHGFSGDRGPAISAQLDHPQGLAVDAAGDLYIADTLNNCIRKVTVSGTISTVAGDGTAGFSGDRGPAAEAQLNLPGGVAADSARNLYIADTNNHRIRKITAAGIIDTVAGNGTLGFNGDGGPATAAQLNLPWGVAADSAGNLYIADTNNLRIRKVTVAGIISTVAGNGSAGFYEYSGTATEVPLGFPYGVAVDAAGNFYATDTKNHCVRKVTTDGIISIVAGDGTEGFSGDGGPATAARLDSPYGVAADSAGNIYIADTNNDRIRELTSAGMITTVAGVGGVSFSGDSGPATLAQLGGPYGVAADSAGNLYIADTSNSRIRKVTPAGTISTVAGDGTEGFSGDGGPATAAQLHTPSGVAADSAGSIYIADTGNVRIRKVTPAGVISTVAGNGAFGFSGDGGPAIAAQLAHPYGVAADSSGNIYIADHSNNRIRKVTAAGVISTVAGKGTTGFSGDGGPATAAQLARPYGVAVDSTGNLYIADYWNLRIRKVTTAGIISTLAGSGGDGFSGDGGLATAAYMTGPTGVAADFAGNIYIADYWNGRIRKVTAGGIIDTAAGDGTDGFSGDGGPATAAQLSSPWGVATDSAGNLYIADTNNNRVRKVVPGKPESSLDLTLSAGGAASSFTAGGGETVQAGYAILTVNSDTTPYGTAVFSFKQNGVTVSEAGVPASPPTTSARIFIDYRSAVAAVPGRIDAGTIDINTGIAVVNLGSGMGNVTYHLRNSLGATLSNGHGTIAAGAHFAKFIDQLKDVASDFSLPSDFQSAIQFGSLDISSDQPLSILALRMTTNQRNEVLFTTTPTADLSRSLTRTPVYFPQFADGGGYTTALILLNTSTGTETGTFQILDDLGAPLVVSQVGGTADSSFKYSIASGGAFRFQTDGFPITTKVGWVQLTPDADTSTPVGTGIFGYNPGNILVTESGVPAAASTTHARVYVDLSGRHNTGLAIANLSKSGANVSIKAFQSDGITGIGTSQGPLLLPGKGHSAKFASEFVAGLSAGFAGVLDISSETPFAALTMRSLTNERGDFLLTTFPIADANGAAPSPIVFPQIADGGGYVTQFILLSPGGASSAKLNFYGETGAPLAVGRQ